MIQVAILIILSTHWVLTTPKVFTIIGITPPPVIIRSIRPYIKPIVILTWIWIRLVVPFFSTDNDGGVLGGGGGEVVSDYSYTSGTTPPSSSSPSGLVVVDDRNHTDSCTADNTCYTYEERIDSPVDDAITTIEFSWNKNHGVLDLVFYFMKTIQNQILNNNNNNQNHKLIMMNPPPPQDNDDNTNSNLSHLFILLLNDYLGLLLIQIILQRLIQIYNFSLFEWKERLIQDVFDFGLNHIPLLQKEMIKEEDKMEKSLKETLFGNSDRSNDGDDSGVDNCRFVSTGGLLPIEGRDPIQVAKNLLQRAEKENEKWQKGFVSGAVYSGETNHNALLNTVYAAYSLSNPLHPDIWPSVNQCEAELISMTSNLLNGNDTNVVGTSSSGGTESIILAVRAHLKIYGERRGIEHPEIICADTAHAGLDKACDMFHIRLIKISCNDTTNFRLDPRQVEKHMSSNVIMIYSSAPCFPQGVIDPIEDLSRVALKYGVGLHVDACLGGFVLPFARMLGYDIPKFDFECPGVTSMSADTHKYGYASKGTSVVLYRNKALRRAQYFNYSKWTGGLYVTPTIAGSRPGALLACAWASLVTIGESGFKSRVKVILDATQKIANAVSEIQGLRILGEPEAMIVCFASDDDDIDTYAIGDKMTHKGWSLNSLQNPACIHICVTLRTVEHVDKFIDDLNVVVRILKEEASMGKVKTEGSAAIYGMAGSMPAGPVNELLKLYTDVSLTCYHDVDSPNGSIGTK